ncbi:hypothetical protein J7J84_00080 [bacterium]|nr:hypothetical protein [bacterium]
MHSLGASYHSSGTLLLAAVLGAAVVLLVVPVLPQTASAQEEPPDIAAIELDLEWIEGQPGDAVTAEVKEAIERTLSLAIIDQLGASLQRLEANREQITRTLFSVLDLVLGKRGIVLKELDIVPGEITLVRLQLALQGQTIENFTVYFRFTSDTPFLAAITEADRNSLAVSLAGSLSGTPYSDADWIERMVIRQVRDYLSASEDYAGFDTLVLVLPETATSVYVTLIPREDVTVVNRYFVKLRSSTMLNLQLADVGSFVSANLESLRGLPTEFVARKAKEICDYLAAEAVFAPDVSLLKPEASAELFVVHDDISLVFAVESRRVRLSASGRVDFNREEDEARFDFTAGLRISPASDVWFHGTFFPAKFELRPQLGIGLRAENLAMLEAGYDFKMNSTVLRGRLNVLPDFYFSAEHYAKSRLKDENEYGITYIFRNYYEFKVTTDFRDELFASVGVRI